MSGSDVALICSVIFGARTIDSKGWAQFWSWVWLILAFVLGVGEKLA